MVIIITIKLKKSQVYF